MNKVPNYALYGTDAQPAWMGMLHFERIPERSSRHQFSIDPHMHDALIQVLYVRRGSGEAVIDGVTWPVRPETLIVVPARHVHGFRFSADIDGPVVTAAQRPLESLMSVAGPGLLRLVRTPAARPVAPAWRHAEVLIPLFDAIEREACIDAPGHVIAGMSLLINLFVQIARVDASLHGAAVAANDDAHLLYGATRSRKAEQVERFRALVDQRFRERVPVDRYAQELGLTLGQLTRLCREILGQSSLEVVNARVVHEAQRELVYSSLSIKQIANLLGFADEAYFSRFFKKHTQQRPSDFRDMARHRMKMG
ncbi:MAG: helix-turn-helix domain-containing protein [Burkholderiales bacterium]